MGKLLNTTDVSEHYEVDERSVYRWRKEGLPWDGGTDSLVLHEWLKERDITRRFGGTADGKILDLNAERARHSKEQADKLEMENATRRGLLMDANAVAALWAKIAVSAKTLLLAIPSKAAPLLVGKKIAEIKDILETQVHECALAIAGDPLGESLDAAAEADGKPVGRRKSKIKPRGKRGTGKVANRKG